MKPIPSIIVAHSLIEINASLATAAPALLGLTNEHERKKITATIEYQLQQLNDSSIWLGGASDYPFESLALQSMSVNISNNLVRQISLVKQRLAYLQKANQLQKITLLAMTKVHDISTSLVANTMTTAVASSLYDLADANVALPAAVGKMPCMWLLIGSLKWTWTTWTGCMSCANALQASWACSQYCLSKPHCLHYISLSKISSSIWLCLSAELQR